MASFIGKMKRRGEKKGYLYLLFRQNHLGYLGFFWGWVVISKSKLWTISLVMAWDESCVVFFFAIEKSHVFSNVNVGCLRVFDGSARNLYFLWNVSCEPHPLLENLL